MSGTVAAVEALDRALHEVGDALATADLGRLLAAESQLAAAFDALHTNGVLDRNPDVAVAVARARDALRRCTRLGSSLVALTQLTLDPSGAREYSRSGTAPVRACGSALHTRV